MSDAVKTKCPKCKVTNPTTFAKCRHCGTELPTIAAAAPAPSANAIIEGLPPVSTATGPVGGPAGRPVRPGETVSEETPGRNIKTPLIAGGVVALLLVAFLGMRAFAPPAAAEPSGYTIHKTGDGQFQCDAPDGWDMTTASGANGVSGGSKFRRGTAFIQVSTDAAGSMMTDIMKASNDGKTPTQKLHEMTVEKMSEQFSDYEEKPSKMYMGKFGETWYCEFTANGGFREGQIHGIRATMMTSERRIRYTATCPENDWPILKKSFYRVLNSVAAPGTTATSAPAPAASSAPALTAPPAP